MILCGWFSRSRIENVAAEKKADPQEFIDDAIRAGLLVGRVNKGRQEFMLTRDGLECSSAITH